MHDGSTARLAETNGVCGSRFLNLCTMAMVESSRLVAPHTVRGEWREGTPGAMHEMPDSKMSMLKSTGRFFVEIPRVDDMRRRPVGRQQQQYAGAYACGVDGHMLEHRAHTLAALFVGRRSDETASAREGIVAQGQAGLRASYSTRSPKPPTQNLRPERWAHAPDPSLMPEPSTHAGKMHFLFNFTCNFLHRSPTAPPTSFLEKGEGVREPQGVMLPH